MPPGQANPVPGSPEPVWQQRGPDDWVFGPILRGIVRPVVGAVYFDPDKEDRRGGWCWRVDRADKSAVGGIAYSLLHAVDAVEAALGYPAPLGFTRP